LPLRASDSGLSRQIRALEYGCGFRLFDRIGRRLFLTTRGEQLLGDCREVLGQVGSLGERIELLKRGDSGVLKLAAPPQTIESVLSRFLPRYAKIVRITHRRKPLRDRYVIQWDKRRPMPSYAQNFCAALGAYMRDVLPITRPSSR